MSVTTEQIRELPGMTPPPPKVVRINASDDRQYRWEGDETNFHQAYTNALTAGTAIQVRVSGTSKLVWLAASHIVSWWQE